MTLDEVCEQLVRLGQQEINFDVGEVASDATWHEAEQRIARPIPIAWLTFAKAFGSGEIELRNGGKRAIPTVASILSGFKVPDLNRSASERSIEVEISDPDFVEVLWAMREKPIHPSSGLDEPWLDWVLVGRSAGGDQLGLFVPRNAVARIEDTTVGWWNHEVGSFTYMWPSVLAYLESLLKMHSVAEQTLLGLLGYQRELDAIFEYARTRATDLSIKLAFEGSDGSVICPHCGSRFHPSVPESWNGKYHSHCGGAIEIQSK